MSDGSATAQVILPAPRRSAEGNGHTRAVLDAIGRGAVGETPLRSALQATLDALCVELGFPVAHAYLYEDALGEFVSTSLWHVSNASRFGPLIRHTAASPVVPGVGLVGRVVETAAPAWVHVIQDDPLFRRSRIALTAGLRGAFAFPVLVRGRVVAVVEVMAPRHLEDDPDLAELVAQVAWLLGTVLAKARPLVSQ